MAPSPPVAPGADPVTGQVQVLDTDRDVRRVRELVKRKYGIAFTVVTLIERVMRRGREDRSVLLVSLD